MRHALIQVAILCALAGFLAGFFVGYQPRHPTAVLALSSCQVPSGYLIVMSDGKLVRLTAQTLYYDDDAADAMDTLLDTYPPQAVNIGGCT